MILSLAKWDAQCGSSVHETVKGKERDTVPPFWTQDILTALDTRAKIVLRIHLPLRMFNKSIKCLNIQVSEEHQNKKFLNFSLIEIM